MTESLEEINAESPCMALNERMVTGKSRALEHVGSEWSDIKEVTTGSCHQSPRSFILWIESRFSFFISNALVSNIRDLLPLSFLSFLLFSAFIKISNVFFFIVKGNGNQFEDIWVFIKSVQAFNCRFYLLCFIFDPAFSATTLFANPF